MRDVLVDALGRPGVPPAGRRGRVVLDDFVIADDVWAAFQIPIGLAFLHALERDGGVVALYPSPGGRDGVRARPDGVGRAGARPTRCSSASSPTPRR